VIGIIGIITIQLLLAAEETQVRC